MTNTQTRLVSALIIIIGVIGLFLVGPNAVSGFVVFVGLLVQDELLVNFLKRDRFSPVYLLTQGLFTGLYVGVNFLAQNTELFKVTTFLAFAVNIVLLIFLFSKSGFSKKLRRAVEKFPILIVFLMGIPFMSFGSLFRHENWIVYCWSFLFVTYFVDTGAYFVGRKYGRTKLWPSVSPGKTVEGTVGGVFVSVVLNVIYWSVFIDDGVKWYVVLSLFGLSLASQTGDLIQSKFKRIYGLKDSSALIPGHGGVYDRVDSLIFVAPFYAFMLEFLI